MKRFFFPIIITILFLLFSPTLGIARSFNYTTPNTVSINTTENKAVFSITVSKYYSGYIETNDSLESEFDLKQNMIETFPIKKGTVPYTTKTTLSPGTSYFLYLKPSSKGDIEKYPFITDPISVVKNGVNQLKITSVNGSVVASIVTASTETRPLSINIESVLSPGISVVRKDVPGDIAIASRKGIGVFDMGTLPLAIGSYNIYLEAGTAPLYTKLVGPFQYEVHDTTLTYQWPLTASEKNDTSITLSGKIVAGKNIDPRSYSITFEIADTATVFGPDAQGGDTEIRQVPISSIAPDGNYSITVNNLTASQVYYFRHTIKSPYSESQSRVGKLSGKDGILAYGDAGDTQKDFNNRSYRLLSPLPGLSAVLDPDLCSEYAKEGKSLANGTICDINQFLNYVLKLLIGLAGVVLVLRIMFEGYQYLVTDVPALKSGAKNNLLESVLGLVLALSAYLILNTINPQLVSNGITLNDVAAGVESFTISGGASFDGKPIKVDFKSDAYPKAKIASNKTGVDTAFILAMFDQESSSGANSGTCHPKIPNTNMPDDQYVYLRDDLIPKHFNKNTKNKTTLTITSINISCVSDGSKTGGAFGYTQFMPLTWKEYMSDGQKLLGTDPYPWDVQDTLMMTALFLKKHGGDSTDPAKQEAAACSYFGSCSNNSLINCGGTKKTYGECVMGKKLSIQQQIDEGIKNGTLK